MIFTSKPIERKPAPEREIVFTAHLVDATTATWSRMLTELWAKVPGKVIMMQKVGQYGVVADGRWIAPGRIKAITWKDGPGSVTYE